jgi:hypothetical protein
MRFIIPIIFQPYLTWNTSDLMRRKSLACSDPIIHGDLTILNVVRPGRVNGFIRQIDFDAATIGPVRKPTYTTTLKSNITTPTERK